MTEQKKRLDATPIAEAPQVKVENTDHVRPERRFGPVGWFTFGLGVMAVLIFVLYLFRLF